MTKDPDVAATEVLKWVGTVTTPSTADYILDHAPADRDDRDNARSPILATTKLLFVTCEMSGFLQAGGLGEISAALPRQLRAFCDLRVLIPGYRQVRAIKPGMEIIRQMPRTAGLPPWSLGRFSTVDGLEIYTVLCDELYNRDGTPYGPRAGEDFGDNDIRFGRLSLAAAEIAAGEADPNWKPDIVHVNDWPSALAPGYMHWKGLATPSILTVHNLAYQGQYEPERMSMLGIPDFAFNIDGAEFYGKISFLKSGIFYGSHVTTVSETYAQEITTPEYGCGLEGLLRTRMDEGRLTGIINGVDDSWNALIEGGKTTEQIVRSWKCRNAAEIRKTFELPDSRGPLFSIISRLVHQKGIDLSLEVAETIVSKGGQLIIMGRGMSRYEERAENLALKFPGAIAVRIGFDDGDARRLFAASDFLLMPSRFEPCGLSQMYAQLSGALPIAHRIGGLVDTVEDGFSGIMFSPATRARLTGAVTRAFEVFRLRRLFCQMRKRAMAKNFGWHRSAIRYADVYARALDP